MKDFKDAQVKGTVEEGAVLKGAVSVGEGTLIKSGAYIEGPVIIGENCVIGPNCYVRKFTSIGDRCVIGQSVEIKNSIIMPNCHIQHLSYIGDSVVGEASNIGAGTKTANRRHDGENPQSMIKGHLLDTKREKMGAIFSDGVQIGINTSVYPGRKVWPHMATQPAAVIDKDVMPQDFDW